MKSSFFRITSALLWLAFGSVSTRAADGPLYVLLMGQSNAVGWTINYQDMDNPGDLVKVWHWDQKEWQPWDLLIRPTQIQYGRSDSGNNIAFHFSKKIAELTGREVRVIVVAKGGIPISNWVPESGIRYQELLQQASDSGVSQFDVVLWHQGETDAFRGPVAYRPDFDTLLTQLRGDSFIGPDTAFIAGQVSDANAFTAQMNQFFSPDIFAADYEQDGVYLAETGDYEFVPQDPIHFAPNGLINMGRIGYFETYLRYLNDRNIQDVIPATPFAAPDLEIDMNSDPLSLNLWSLAGITSATAVTTSHIDVTSGNALLSDFSITSGVASLEIGRGLTGVASVTAWVCTANQIFRTGFQVHVRERIEQQLPAIQIASDSGPLNFNLIPLINPAISVDSIENEFIVASPGTSTLSQVSVSQGILTIDPADGSSGSHQIILELDSVQSLRYVLTIPVEIGPPGSGSSPGLGIPLTPWTLVSSESAPRTINLFSRFGIDDPAGFTPIVLNSTQNDAVLQSYSLADGLLTAVPAPGAEGVATLRFSTTSPDGTGFSGSLEIRVIPGVTTLTAPQLVIAENSGQQFVSLTDLVGLDSHRDFKSLTMRSISNSQWLASSEFLKGDLVFESAPDQFGEIGFIIDAVDVTDRPWVLEVPVLITATTRTVSVPAQIIPENSGQRSLGLLGYFGIPDADSLSSMSIVSSTNGALLSSAVLLDGVLQYATAPDRFGTVSLFIEAQDTRGRPYESKVDIAIIAAIRQASVPQVTINENSGQHTLPILDYFIASGLSQLQAIAVTETTNGHLLQNISIQNGVLFFQPALDSFGDATITVRALEPDGRPWSALVQIHITPGEEEVLIPDQVIVENSGTHQLALPDLFGLSGPQEFTRLEIIQTVNGELLSTALIFDGILSWQTGPDRFGTVTITMEAVDTRGKHYNASVNIIIEPLTIDVSIPLQSVPENSPQQILPIYTFLGLVTSSELQSMQIIDSVNAGLLQNLSADNGSLVYVPASNVFGTAEVQLSALDTTGRPYSASVTIEITPLTRGIAIPQQTVPENSGQQILPLLSYFGMSSINQLQSMEIVSSVSGEKLQRAAIVNGQLVYTPAQDSFGSVRITLSVHDTTGRPYSATVPIEITPLTRQISLPPQTVPENSGQHVLPLLGFFGLSSPDQLQSMEIISSTNGERLQSAAILDGQLVYTTAPDTFGSVQLNLSARDTTGRPYSASVSIEITPLTRGISIPPQAVAENSGQHVLPLLGFFGLSSPDQLQSMEIISSTNGERLQSAAILDGQLVYTTAPDTFGSVQLNLSARDTTGRPYSASASIEITPLTRGISIPPQTLAENSGQQVLPLLGFFGLSSPDQLQSMEIISSTNGERLQSAAILDGQLVYTTAPDTFGSVQLNLSARDTTGRPYSASVSIEITPLTRGISIPAQTVTENSGQHLLPLLGFFGLSSPDQLQSMEIISSTNGEKLQSAAILDGQLVYTPSPDTFGSVQLNLSALDTTGRPYSASVSIEISPLTRGISIPPQTVAENSGQHVLPLLGFFGLSSPDQLQSMEIISSTNGERLQSAAILDGQLVYTTAPDTFGSVQLNLSARDTTGRPYSASASIEITPLTRGISIPPQTVAENSGQHVLPLLGFFGLSSPDQLQSMEIIASTNGEKLQSAAILDGQLVYTPAPDTFGSVQLNLSALDTTGRPYSASVSIEITPLTRGISIPPQTVAENSGQHVLPLLGFFGLSSPDQLQSTEIISSTNAEILNAFQIVEGALQFSTASDRFGTSSINLRAVDETGRPYSATVTIEVQPKTRALELSTVELPENSPQYLFGVISKMKESSGESFSGFTYSVISGQDLVRNIGSTSDSLVIEIARDQFGLISFEFNATAGSGRPFRALLDMMILPQKSILTPAPWQVLENSVNARLDLATTGVDALDEVEIISLSRPELIDSASVESDTLTVTPAGDMFGDLLATLTAVGPDGRPYEIRQEIRIIPETMNLDLPPVYVLSRDGQQIRELSSFFATSGVTQIESIQHRVADSGSVLQNFHIDKFLAVIVPVPDSVGTATVLLNGVSGGGRPFNAELQIIAESTTPLIRLPRLIIASDSSPQSINIGERIISQGRSDPDSLSLFKVVNGELVSNLEFENGTLRFEPGEHMRGSLLFSFAAYSSNFRQYSIEFPVLIDTYMEWISHFVTDEELLDPNLEDVLWGENADSDQDGWKNVAEFCFGGHPLVREIKDRWIESSIFTDPTGSDSYHQIKLRVRTDDPALRVIPQFSSDRAGWDGNPLIFSPSGASVAPNNPALITSQETLDEMPQFLSLTLRDSTPVAVSQPRYFRISISRE